MTVFKLIVLKHAHYSFILKRSVSSQVRVRFAPSPTGYLHLGGLRTALYNYLFAKSQNGVTVLRIEDTDLSRTIPFGVKSLIEDLSWCGITFDEGPYLQSERKEIYQKYAQQLVDQGDAYYCFCSEKRLDLLRKEALKVKAVPKYDNHCRHLSQDEFDHCYGKMSCCIRFKLSNFTDTFIDLINGPTAHDVAAIEGDPIIIKSDGYPTYHLANVVDDHLMNITHVWRGAEWLTSTPKHILLYRAFKWNPPHFGHLPLLINSDGTKLSKRQGSLHIRQLRAEGYFPNALVNFLIRFGGGFDIRITDEVQSYTLDELVKSFNISKIKNHSCQVAFNFLPLYNNAEISRLFETDSGKQALVKKTQELVQKYFQNSKYKNSFDISDERVESILKTLKHRISSLEDLVQKDFHYLWVWERNWNEKDEKLNNFIKNLIEKLRTINWSSEELKIFLESFCKGQSDFKYSDLMQALRFALTGLKSGPGVAEIMSILRKEDVLFRLSKAVESKSESAAGGS